MNGDRTGERSGDRGNGMKLYVVRHGETDWNRIDRLQGNHDVPLNEKGLEQANEAREALKDCEYEVVFSSPLVRAADTARIINEEKQKPIFFDPRLRERNFGSREGMVKGTYNYTELWDYEKNLSYGGESMKVFFERVWDFLDDLKKLPSVETVLLVCHGGTMRAIETYFHGIRVAEGMAGFFSKNAEVRTYEVN